MQRCRKKLCAAKNVAKISLPVCKRTTSNPTLNFRRSLKSQLDTLKRSLKTPLTRHLPKAPLVVTTQHSLRDAKAQRCAGCEYATIASKITKALVRNDWMRFFFYRPLRY